MIETRFLLSDRDNPNAPRDTNGVRWWGRSGRRKPATCVVVHTAETVPTGSSARSVAQWQSGAPVPSSYHVLVDSHLTVRTVNDRDTAYHVANFNDGSLGLSFATYAGWWGRHPGWDEAALQRAAVVCRQWMALYGIPARWLSRDQAVAGRAGFVRHSTMDPSRRGDPGRNFPAAQFFRLLETKDDDMPLTDADVARVAKAVNDYRSSPERTHLYNAALTAANRSDAALAVLQQMNGSTVDTAAIIARLDRQDARAAELLEEVRSLVDGRGQVAADTIVDAIAARLAGL